MFVKYNLPVPFFHFYMKTAVIISDVD